MSMSSLLKVMALRECHFGLAGDPLYLTPRLCGVLMVYPIHIYIE